MRAQDFPLSGRFLKGRLRYALTDAEMRRIEALFSEVKEYDPRTPLMERGERYDHSSMLVDGFVIRTMPQGGQQRIIGFQVPGDFFDLHAFALKRLDHSIQTLGRATIAYVSHSALETLIVEEPRLARVLWFSTLLDAAIHREWIMALGSLRAEGRAAHFFAEAWTRLDMVGLARPKGYQLPLTQEDLANICGTTAIHMNRVLRDLREGGVVEFRRGRVIAEDRARLEAHGRFDPAYLYGQGSAQHRRTALAGIGRCGQEPKRADRYLRLTGRGTEWLSANERTTSSSPVCIGPAPACWRG